MNRIRRFIFIAMIGTPFLLAAACSQNAEESGTLVALGDSITYGANLADSESMAYPYVLGEKAGFKVHNLAVSGWQTGDVMGALRNDSEYRQTVEGADYIAMTIGGNDLLEVLEAAEVESGGDLAQMKEYVAAEIGSEAVAERIGEVIEEIRSLTDADILLYNIYNPFPGHSKMFEMGESLLPEVNEAFLAVAEDHDGVYIADAYKAYDDKQEEYIIVDDIHPTEEGQEILAEIGLDALELN